MSDFILDIERIRKDARTHTETGAVTPAYQADRQVILKILDTALATEWICVLRYSQHARAAQGIHAETVGTHFAEHARQEQEHAASLSERIKQLGGTPSLNPSEFAAKAHTQYVECTNLAEMIKENLIAERIAIDAYTAAIRYIGDSDPTTRRMLETILAVEEEHADEMADLMVSFDKPGGGSLN